MSIRRTITLLSTLALTTIVLTTASASATPTRELITTFGAFGEPAGVAVDLETGNVYVTDTKTETVDIFSATGGPPTDGVPLQIAGLHIGEFEEAEGEPQGVAVDNSCYEHTPRLTGKECEEYDPSYGDVYVPASNQGQNPRGIEKFKLNTSHEYEPAGYMQHSESPSGITIDSQGNIYGVTESGQLYELRKVVEKIVNGGKEETSERLEEITIPQSIIRNPGYVAVDDLGDTYIGESFEGGFASGSRGVTKLKLGVTGDIITEEIFTGKILGDRRPVVVDSAAGVVYVGDGSEVAEYSSAGTLQLMFGSREPFGGSLGRYENGIKGIAVNPETGLVYLVNTLHHDVVVFGGVLVPPVFEAQQPAASSITQTSALIGGSVNPESGQASYYFEYVDDQEYEPGAAEPYRAGGRTATGALTGGHKVQTVQRLPLTGLRPGTTYDYRMVVSNATGTVYGPDETFATAVATPPVPGTGPAGEVTATSVTLTGTVEPRGLPTSYVFEVGTDTSYGGAKLFGDAGAGTGEVAVAVGLQYLVPDTTYHYRLVVTSFDGTSYGQDETFTTPGVPSTIGQPASFPLIPSPTVQFPSVAGAITEPVGAAKSKPKSKPAKRTGKRKRSKRKKGRGRKAVRVRAY
jgi:NHL repeat